MHKDNHSDRNWRGGGEKKIQREYRYVLKVILMHTGHYTNIQCMVFISDPSLFLPVTVVHSILSVNIGLYLQAPSGGNEITLETPWFDNEFR